MKDYFFIAKVTSLFGRNGFVKIELFPNFFEYLNELDKVFIDFWGDKKIFYVDEVKHVGNAFALKFKSLMTKEMPEFLLEEIYLLQKMILKIYLKTLFPLTI